MLGIFSALCELRVSLNVLEIIKHFLKGSHVIGIFRSGKMKPELQYLVWTTLEVTAAPSYASRFESRRNPLRAPSVLEIFFFFFHPESQHKTEQWSDL
jgi:hypothetical protein